MGTLQLILGSILIGCAMDAFNSERPWWYATIYLLLGLFLIGKGVVGIISTFGAGDEMNRKRQEE